MSTWHLIVGMLSIQELLQFINIDGDEVNYVRGKRMADAMSPETINADPLSDIRRVAEVMQENRLHALPIVNQ